MIKNGFIVGIATFVIGIGMSFLLSPLIPSLALEYQNPALFRPWTDPLMTLFFAYPFIFGLVSAYLWSMVGKSFKGSNSSKAFQFAKIYFLIVTIPGMFMSYTSFQVSFLMVLSWTVTGLVEAYVAGYILARMDR